MRHVFILLALSVLLSLHLQLAAGDDKGNAARIYQDACDEIVVDSTMDAWDSTHFRAYPPYGVHQLKTAANEWAASKHIRDLCRQARSIPNADWQGTGNNVLSPNALRQLAGNQADAALYEDVQGDHAEALEEVRDFIQLAELRLDQPPHLLLNSLSGTGLMAMAMIRLEVIVSGSPLTNDPADLRDIQVRTARDLIAQLLAEPDLKKLEFNLPNYATPPTPAQGAGIRGRVNTTFNRIRSENLLAATSLACHLYLFDHQRWPNSLDELVPGYLPKAPIDPFGDGTQPLGYALIKHSLPDRLDRPLVYDRDNATSGLFYQIDGPTYEWTFGDGSNAATAFQKHGGQFRDVARWVGPTMRPDPAIEYLKQ